MLDKRELLERFEIFKDVSPKTLHLMALTAQVISYGYKDRVFAEGERGFQVFLIHEGEIKLYKRHIYGKELTFEVRPGGLLMGEEILFEDQDYEHGARVISQSAELIALERTKLIEVLGSDTQLCGNLMSFLARGMTSLRETMLRVNYQDVQGWVAAAMLSVSEGVLERLSQMEIAKMAGVSTKTVTRYVKEFRDRGILKPKVEGRVRGIQINDRDRLCELAGLLE